MERNSEAAVFLSAHNEEVESNLRRTVEGGLRGNVCVLCDKLMSGIETESMTLENLAKHRSHAVGNPNLPDSHFPCKKSALLGLQLPTHQPKQNAAQRDTAQRPLKTCMVTSPHLGCHVTVTLKLR